MAIGTLVLDVKRAEGRCRTGASAWGDIPKGSELFVKGEAPPPPPPPAPCRPPRSRATGVPEGRAMVRAGVPPGGRAGRRARRPGARPPGGVGTRCSPPSPGEGPPSFSAAPESAARVEGSDPGAPPPRGAGRTAAALGWASTAGGAGGSVRGLVVSARVLWAVGSSICRPWPRRTARAGPTLELLLHRGCRSDRSSGVRGPGEGRAPVGRSTESGAPAVVCRGSGWTLVSLVGLWTVARRSLSKAVCSCCCCFEGSRSRTVGPVVGLDGGEQALGQLGLGPGGGDAVRVCGRGPSGP